MDVKAELSPKIIKKGDRFMVYITATNDSEKEITLNQVKIDLPAGFIAVKRKQSTNHLAIRANLRKALATQLPPDLEVANMDEPINKPIHPHEPYPVLFQIKAGWSANPFYPRPETYTIRFTVEYKLEGKVFFAFKSVDLSLFPSFGSILSGTLVGSLLGTVVRNANTISGSIGGNAGNTMSQIQNATAAANQGLFDQAMAIFIVPLIFGLIAGLILMRRKDVQPFLTIEDFWGGIIVGFVVGYGGSEIVTRLLPSDLDTVPNSTSVP